MDEHIEPLHYSLPPPTPRPSFVRNLQLSSYLLPPKPRLSVTYSSAISDQCKQTAARDNCKLKGSFDGASHISNDPEMASRAYNEFNKKKVTFHRYVNVIAPEHIPTEEEKRRIWYNKEDYNAFKFNAASDADVRLMDFFSTARNQFHSKGARRKFVMIGNFDSVDEKKSSCFTDATVASGPKFAESSYHVPKKCLNEYKDSINKAGDEVCKRGLGYHFSKHRKRNKVWTRAMVLTWQKTMRSMTVEGGMIQDPHHQEPLTLSQKCNLKLNEKCWRTLAIISSHCSRSSRQAALWRGRMDYEVTRNLEKTKVSVDKDCTDMKVDAAKRTIDDCDHQRCRKRQCCDNRNSAAACTYLAGVLAIEI